MAEHRILTADDLRSELVFTTSRSSGPGGQNVNKVNTKVTLRFDVRNSAILQAEEKKLLNRKLATRITTDGILIISAQDKRSQLQNREEVINKFDRLLTNVFTIRKRRKQTKPGKSAKYARLKEKKHRAEKKQWRQKRLD